MDETVSLVSPWSVMYLTLRIWNRVLPAQISFANPENVIEHLTTAIRKAQSLMDIKTAFSHKKHSGQYSNYTCA